MVAEDAGVPGEAEKEDKEKRVKWDMYQPDSLEHAVAVWRSRQPGLPNRTDAVTKLLTRQLEAEGISVKPVKPEPGPAS